MIKSELVQKIADGNTHLYHRDVERIVSDADVTPFAMELRVTKHEFLQFRVGQRLTVRLSWRRHHDKILGDNNAEFWVGDLPDFDAAGEVKFGNKFDNGKAWTGRLPKTGDYFIYITAHPSARYTLRVTFN